MIHISKQVMANWMIQCADRYLGILYDYFHKELYRFHVLQADETPVMVSKDGRPANSRSYMWIYREYSGLRDTGVRGFGNRHSGSQKTMIPGMETIHTMP